MSAQVPYILSQSLAFLTYFQMSLQVIGKTHGLLPKLTQDNSASDAPQLDGQAPAVTKYDLRTLRHSNLETDRTFTELKSKLEEYYEDRKLPTHRQQVLPYRPGHWKEVLYNSLLVLLSEVTFTNNGAQQQDLLARVKKWYDEKTAPRKKLPALIKRKDAVRPNSRRLSKSETPLKVRKANIEHKRLDKIKSIESRSPSPVKAVNLPRLVVSLDNRSFDEKKAIPEGELTEAEMSARYIDIREKELLEMKAASARNSDR